MPIRIRNVAPTGTSHGFGDWHDEATGEMRGGIVELPTYPPSPNGERLRALRVERGMGLRAAATLLGLSPAELSGLERGRHDTDDWAAVFEAMDNKREG